MRSSGSSELLLEQQEQQERLRNLKLAPKKSNVKKQKRTCKERIKFYLTSRYGLTATIIIADRLIGYKITVLRSLQHGIPIGDWRSLVAVFSSFIRGSRHLYTDTLFYGHSNYLHNHETRRP